MTVLIEMRVRIGQVPTGGGTSFGAQAQANIPGQGQIPQNARAAFTAQVADFIVAEGVPGGDTPTLANINTALTNCVTDLAGSSGTPLITPALLLQIQNFAKGQP